MASRSAQIFLRASLTLVFLLCAVAGIFLGLSDYYDRQVRKIFDDWRESGYSVSNWEQAFDLSAAALRFNPWNPELHQRTALLLRIRLLTEDLDEEERQKLTRSAVSHLEKSLGIRPSWSAALADLAYVKWMAGDDKTEVMTLLRRAIDAGPWETSAIELVTYIGLRDFGKLNNADQQFVIDSAARGLRSPVGSFHLNILSRVKTMPHLKPDFVEVLQPHLVRSWPQTSQYSLFVLSEWSWEFLSAEQRNDVVNESMKALEDVNPKYAWIGYLTSTEFKQVLCQRALLRAPDDGKLNYWCSEWI